MSDPENIVSSVNVRRFKANPLIDRHASGSLGDNINGASVIRVPNWLPDPLGKYYMYFAHHSGRHIRLAYANDLEGRWTIHEPGALQLEEATAFYRHIASPDVHVDDENRQFLMYFHGPARERKDQWTGVARSSNGIDFKPSTEILGKFYFRVWKWQNSYYALAKNFNEGWGELYRSGDGLTGFESRGNFLKDARHTSVLVHGHYLLVFYSRVGDAPERIVMSSIDMRSDWSDWQPSRPIEVLRPEKTYEGIEYPISASTHGSAIEVQELRDPCIFAENGRIYLYYCIAGEMGIAGAEINLHHTSKTDPGI